MKQTIKLMPTIMAILSICLALVLTSEPLSEVLSKTQLEYKPHTIIIDKNGVITYTSGATLTKSQLIDLINEAKDN